MSVQPAGKLLLLACLILGAPAIVLGLLNIRNNTTDMALWLPDSLPAREDYQWLINNFGVDDFLLVSWPGCVVTDPRTQQVADLLSGAAAPEATRQWIHRVVVPRDLVQRLTAKPVKLTRKAALRRLRGFLVGPDGETATLLVELTPAGRGQPQQLIAAVREACAQAGISAQTVRMAGSVYQVVMIDRASDRTFRQFVLPSCLLAFFVAFGCLRSLRMSIVILVIAGYCAGASVAIVYFSGRHLNAVLIVLPTLVFVLTTAGAVHLANYYAQAEPWLGKRMAPWYALQVGWLPCLLAAGSTAIGMGSLMASDLSPVRTFGQFASAGILVATPILLLAFPVILSLTQSGGDQTRPLRRERASLRLIQCVSDATIRQHRWLIAGLLGLLSIAAVGITRIKTTVQLERMFPAKHELAQNYRWFEKHIGPLYSVEIVLRYADECRLDIRQRLQLVADVQKSLVKEEEIGTVVSAANFLPPIPRGRGLSATVGRSLFMSRLRNARPNLVRDRHVAAEPGGELWRISARVSALQAIDFEQLIVKLRGVTDGVMERTIGSERSSVSVKFTGGYPLIHTAQDQLLNDLIKSFVIAFALICPTMMLALRSVRAGLLAMVPNIFPVLMVFGLLGWLGQPVDIGSVLTASIALGIAVNDTLHFLIWYRRSGRRGCDNDERIRTTYQHCAMAMVQTTLICGVGLLVFVPTDFLPASRFSGLLLLILLIALIGDLILLPALLASRLGKAWMETPQAQHGLGQERRRP